MNENKFLLVKGMAGLGNRMLSALTGILYARLTGRKLIIDWSDHYYSSDGSNVFHRYFECPLTNPMNEIPATDSVSPPIWRGHLNESAWHLRKEQGKVYGSNVWQIFSVDLKKLNYDEEVIVMWTYDDKIDLLRNHFEGEFEEFNGMSTEEILRKLLREYLVLDPEIRARIDRFKESNLNGNNVGVHIRYTDYRTDVWAILKKLNSLTKQEPELQIFLTTDNLQIKKMFEDLYPGVITTQHWYSSTPGLNIHQNRKRPDAFESGVEALMDLHLLPECNYLIIDSSSSFSYIAKLLTDTPGSNIYDVGTRKKQTQRLRRQITRIMLRLGLFSWGINLIGGAARIHRYFSR
jgi:hypothetical protein